MPYLSDPFHLFRFTFGSFGTCFCLLSFFVSAFIPFDIGLIFWCLNSFFKQTYVFASLETLLIPLFWGVVDPLNPSFIPNLPECQIRAKVTSSGYASGQVLFFQYFSLGVFQPFSFWIMMMYVQGLILPRMSACCG